jgi:hypothetical protein
MNGVGNLPACTLSGNPITARITNSHKKPTIFPRRLRFPVIFAMPLHHKSTTQRHKPAKLLRTVPLITECNDFFG